MQVKPIKTRIFREGEDLVAFIRSYVPKLKEGSVLVVTSKIVALAEKRTAPVTDAKGKEKIIRAESTFALATKWVWLTLKDGLVVAGAGIDESNADGKLVLLPKDSYRAASHLRKVLKEAYGLKELGILITDSRVLPLRAGVMGVALGYAGFKGLKDYRGKKDLFGRPFVFATANMADCLASAAMITQGEGAESQPLALIEGAPVTWTDSVRRTELTIDLEDDIYLPFFSKIPVAKLRKSA